MFHQICTFQSVSSWICASVTTLLATFWYLAVQMLTRPTVGCRCGMADHDSARVWVLWMERNFWWEQIDFFVWPERTLDRYRNKMFTLGCFTPDIFLHLPSSSCLSSSSPYNSCLIAHTVMYSASLKTLLLSPNVSTMMHQQQRTYLYPC